MKKVKNNEEKPKLQPRRVIARWMAFLSIVSGIVGYSLSFNAYPDPTHASYGTIHYTIQNLGLVFIILQLILAWVVKRMQKGVYWFWWLQLQNVKPDERQAIVRQRVFARAYGLSLVLMALFLRGAIQSFTQYTDPAQGDLISRTVWVLVIFFVSLPSILAAWEKNS
jgi:hypothetical protein